MTEYNGEKITTARNKTNLIGLNFDGKRDVSLVNEKERNKFSMRKVAGEHISLLMKPGGKYIGHFTLIKSRSRSILEVIAKYTKDSRVSLSLLFTIGCDGTNVSTGINEGLIVLMEHYLKKPLHRFICMLHANELPLSHLFSNLDGKKSGPRCFTGTIGKLLKTAKSDR